MITGWTDEMLYGRMDGWLVRWIDKWMDKLSNIWKEGWMDNWLDGWMKTLHFIIILFLIFIFRESQLMFQVLCCFFFFLTLYFIDPYIIPELSPKLSFS